MEIQFNRGGFEVMAIQNLMKRAIKIIKKGKYRIISERSVEVTENKKKYYSRYKTLPGRTIQTCGCTNFSRHCNQPTRCVHRIVAEWVLMNHQLLNSGGKTNDNKKRV